jgi:hypothetical protein
LFSFKDLLDFFFLHDIGVDDFVVSGMRQSRDGCSCSHLAGIVCLGQHIEAGGLIFKVQDALHLALLLCKFVSDFNETSLDSLVVISQVT